MYIRWVLVNFSRVKKKSKFQNIVHVLCTVVRLLISKGNIVYVV